MVHVMEKGSYLSTILRSEKTVFSSKDIAMLWRDSNRNVVASRLNYFLKKGQLYRIRRGFFAKDKNYNHFELAGRIFLPSYISFETVLGQAGVTFQFYSQIFVAAYLSREIICEEQKYSFRKIKDNILSNQAGVENRGSYSEASPERAFLDVLYINKDYHFDNLDVLNWEKVFEILPIYENKRMEKKVSEFHKYFLEEQ